MYVKITATDQDLESFCYLPLKSGEVYQANYSKIGNDEYKTFLDVIVDEETIVKGVHESRLQILTQDEIRDFRINQIINC
jgi:hypothetical protein